MRKSLVTLLACILAMPAVAQNGSEINRPHFQQQARPAIGFFKANPCSYVEPPPITDMAQLTKRPVMFMYFSMADLGRTTNGGVSVCGQTYQNIGDMIGFAARLAGISDNADADRVFHFVRDNPDGCIIAMPNTDSGIPAETLAEITAHEEIGHCFLRLHHSANGRGWLTADGKAYQ